MVEADRILLGGTASLIGGIDAPSDLFPSGASGGATITAHESLTLGARGVISTGSQGESPAGSININLNENAALIMQPGSLIEATASGTGQGGGIAISGGDVTITGGTVSAETFAGGRGGKIEIDTGQMILNNDGEITTKAGSSGGGGRIKVKADVIELRNGGQISAVSTGSGNAGNLRITAQDELVLDRGVISTSALQAGGGRITIQVGKLIDLQKSLIASSVFQDTGNAGDIRIDPDFLVLDDSQILAQAVAGSGGDIRIVADHLVLSPDSLINAEAGEAGVDGTVATSEPAVDLASALVVLAAPLLDADSLLREPCAARQDVGTSSFIGVGRGGLPAAPDRPLGSAYRSAEAQAAAGATSIRPAALRLPCSSTH